MKINKQPYTQSVIEEIANSITHGIGTLLSIAGLVILIVAACLKGDVWHVVSFAVFGSCLVLLYLASTLYHSFQSEKVKNIFRVMDHSAIYLLIAGSYTPFTLTLLRGGWGWSLFGIVWGLALGGIVFKLFFVNKFNVLSTIIYLMMGWMIVVAAKPLINTLPVNGLYFLLAGGASYSLGTIFYLWEKLRFHHAIWHLFVLLGSVCHFFAVLLYTLPE
ncbi:hemolysin III family protein [Cytophagaceae bacterium DM2B3-1]|uniref:Hemolysin III family protein n=1 Tax=Xanthocytophaga flava TaxID=3048013 RepID=A0ABT7CH60_9BACT|nr:hemolysin III family protein [Xanthocytophaga flavus]MDJ1472331.1 hemolysin III family protein [Xanthocytophaga flavus]MDJ1493028.1 hemolysin III family protein [Xanthocytophaga flavus]